MRRRLASAALLAFALAACSRGCGRPSAQKLTLEPLPAPPSFQVTEGAAGAGLSVVAARPQGPMMGEVRPTITFSRPMVALGALEGEADPARGITIAPAIPGAWRWLGSTSVEFVPKGPVPYATAFTVTVPKGVRSVDGAALPEAFTFSFETPRPRFQRTEPPSGWAWLEPKGPLTLVANQPVRDLAARLQLRANGSPVAFEVKATPMAELQKKEAEPGRRHAVRPPPTEGLTDRRVQYVLTPKAPLPLDAAIELAAEGELAGEEGPLTMSAGPILQARTYGAFRVLALKKCPWDSTECSYGPLQLVASNPLDPASLKAGLKVEPATGIAWDEVSDDRGWGMREGSGRYLNLPGAWRPGTEYRLTIPAGTKDAFGQPLAQAATFTVRTDDLRPELDAGSSQALIEAGGDGALPLRTVNLEKVEVALEPLDPAGMARALAPGDGDALQVTPVERRALDVHATRNRSRTVPVPVRELLAPHAARLFKLELAAPELRAEFPKETWRWRRTVIGQVTDLAVHAKLGAASGLVWVTRLSDGKPVPGADLALHGANGAPRWTGRTDAEGLARLPGLAALVGDPKGGWNGDTPFALVAARAGDDVGVTLASWSGGIDPSAFGMPIDWDGATPRGVGGLFAERGIYRPGEKVHLKGLVRQRKLGALSALTRGKVTVAVAGPRGKELATLEPRLTGFGTFSAELTVPADADLGTYSAHATVQGEGGELTYDASFRVEEYRAPQFQVDVVGLPPSLVAGEAVSGQVRARYLFGGAMPGAAVRWAVTRSTVDFQPPGHDAFSFGAHVWGWDDGEPEPSGDVPAAGQGETDAAGVLTVNAGTAEATGGRTWSYVLEAEVADVNRQRFANRAAVTVHPASAYAGVRRREAGFAEAGKPATLEVVAVAPGGQRVEKLTVALEVKRREWKWIRKKGAGGEWYTDSEVKEEKVGGCALSSAATPAECAFTPKEPGLYVAEATLTDERGRKQTTKMPFYAVGSGWVSWERGDTSRLDLVPDRQKYEPGDTAKVLVKSPWPEAEAILTVEREGVSAARRVKLAGAAATLEVPIGEDAIPNVYVSVVAVRGRQAVKADTADAGADPGRPEVKVGYAQLRVEKRSKRLEVTVVPDATERRPREKVTVAVQVKDHRGQGTVAEVTAWAVDEGVLRLTGYEAPDPVELLHPPRGLSVRLGEPLIHLVERRKYGEKGLSAGGGGGAGEGGGFRSDFKTTVLFAPEVVTGPDGKATVSFDLPDNLTTFRIMAVAITKEDRAGGGQAKVSVAKPLMALPALPRVARVGDVFEAGVVVHAPSGKIGEATVEASVTGPPGAGAALVLEGDATRKVVLTNGRPQEVRFKLRAEAPGQAVLRFAVAGGAEKDGVEQRLPVELPVSREAVAVYGDTTGSRQEAFAPPGGVRPDFGGLDVTLASTALGGFAENMRQLVDYPYGCLEQLSSRLVPFIALRELQGTFGLGHQPGAGAESWVKAYLGEEALRQRGSLDPDEVVRRTVKEIEALQLPDGGYGYWPGAACSAAWASSYAVLALGRAAELGDPVDAEAFRRGQAWLGGTVAAGRPVGCGWEHGAADPPTRVFALYALARTRAPRPSYYAEFAASRAKLPLFSQAMLADAMFVGNGNRAEARKVLQGVLDHVKESPAEAHVEEADPRTYATLWSSDVRTNGILLQTLATVTPDHPYVGKLAAYLAKARRANGRFSNTQEAAFALMALSEVVRTKEKATPDFEGRVVLGGKTVAEAPFHGRSTEPRTAHVEMKDLPLKGGQLPLEFRRDGATGVLYYGALFRYAPAAPPREALERGIFVQRWIEPYEGGGQVRGAKAGDLVRVKVRIGTPQERHFVAISVPVPSGLEIVDTSLASTAQTGPGRPAPAAEGEGMEEGYQEESEDAQEPDDPWGFRFWSPFNHEERRDARLVLFADRLPPGLHVATFVARATTPGAFVLLPAYAEEMYTPEVFGRSEAGTFTVKVSDEVAQR